MATIKIRRGTTDPITITPSGVTAGEPIFNTVLNKLFVHNGTTGIWVGAEVDNGTGLGSSQTKIPTQYAVKTYVDNNLSSGAVTSINGVTGAARFGAGTGISVTPGTDPDKGITITNIGVQSAVAGTGISVSGATGAVTFTNIGVQSLNGLTGAVTNVARTNQGNTFSVQQVMNAGISASGINVAGSLAQFNNIAGQISFGGTATSLGSITTIVQNSAALLTIMAGPWPGPNATLRLGGVSDLDAEIPYNNDIKPQTTQTGNLTHYLPSTTGTLLNSAVTSAVAGTGISVSGSTGAVTFTNTGVQSAVAGNQITVSGATGAVTIAVTATPSFTSITTTGNGSVGGDLTVTGNLTINGSTTTVNTDTMTIDDPLITIGTSGGLPLSVSDGFKDRGIVFNYYDTAGRTGFFGWDASTPEFVFQQSSTVANEVVTGVTYGNVHVANLRLQNGAVTDTIVGSTSGSQTHQFRNYGGLIVNSNAEPTTGYILKGNSTGSHTWQNPNAAGFTAFAAGQATQLATARTFSLTGNVTATGITFDGTGNVALATTIGSGVVTNAMLVNSGFTLGSTTIALGSTTTTIAGLSSVTATTFTGALTGNATTATALQTARTFSLTGNVTATGITFDGTGNVALSTTIANDAVALGTQTTGNYARDVSVAGIGLTISGAAGEGTQYTITSGATSANTASQIVARNASGDFTAGTITANLTGNVSGSAASLTTARTFSLTGNVTATGITFDGTGNVALATTIGSGVVTNAMLVNSGFTLGSTTIALGSTTTTIAGLSSVTATTFTGSLSGTATTATNVTLTEATSANTTDLYPTFIANGATGGLLIDATTQSGLVALSYRPSTGILTAYKIEAIVDGGSY